MNKLLSPHRNPYAPYWLVGDQKIYNQFEATKTAFRTGGPAYRFVFLEEQYDRLDWSKEPTESWEQLCLANALHIRNKYKKLKLCFSAGRDSGHIWRVFEKNNIHIDELVLAYSPYHPLRKHEHDNYIYPLAVELCKKHPNMKIRVLEMGQDQFEKQLGSDDWLEGPNAQQGRMVFAPYRYNRIITELDPDSGDPNVGYILGLEKPRIDLIDGNFVFRHIDANISHLVYNVPNLEYFYWAPEMPELFLKQCWMVVNYLEKYYPGADQNFLNKFQDTHSVYYDEFAKSVGRGEAIIWECGNGIQKTRDNYHWSIQASVAHAKNNKWKCYDNWNIMVEDLRKNWSHCFNGGDPLKGSIGIWGKPYVIKKQNPVLT
jgi:hypothetical protein